MKVTVTPKSGTEGLRECLVVMSMDGSASGRAMAREDTVGTVSKDEPPIDSWEGRCGLWMGCVALPKPGFTGGVKSSDVVHFMDICGWQVLERLAVAWIEISNVRIIDLFATSRSSGWTR